MRLFLYYWGHTIFNTLKRMMKTWLAILLVCAVMGGIIGLIIGTALPKNKDEDKKNDSKIESVEGEEGEEGEEASAEDKDADEAASKAPKKEAGYKKALRERGIGRSQVVDLIVSLVFFLQLAINITNSKQAGKIFQPGDVPMLFASPMRPQSVMLFRLAGSFVTWRLGCGLDDRGLRHEPYVRYPGAGDFLYDHFTDGGEKGQHQHMPDGVLRCASRHFCALRKAWQQRCDLVGILVLCEQ